MMIGSSIWDKDTSELQWKNIGFSTLNLGTYIISAQENSVTLTLSDANLIPNEFVDKIISIGMNGISENSVVVSNTENTLIIDDPLSISVIGKTLTVLNTLVITDIELNTLIALNTTNGPIGVLLPKSRIENERKFVHVYIEVSGNFQCPVVCRGTDRQAGVKSGYLQYRFEGVRLHTHMWFIPHWDIIQTYGISRYATGYWSIDDAIIALNFTNIIAAKVGAGLIIDNTSRFSPITKDGVNGVQYISLLPRKVSCQLSVTIQKEGASGEANIGFAKYSLATNTTSLINTRIGTTLFGGGSGYQNVTIVAPVDLSFGDELYVVAFKTAGTLSINSGSSIEITEI